MQNTDLAIEAQDIRKTFGHSAALAGVTLKVKRGEFLAFFGSNGAGKTTFLKIVATLMRPTSGTLKVEGIDVRQEPEDARRRIGFLSHNTFVYRDLTSIENLRFFCRLYGINDSDDRIMELLERVGLGKRARDPVRSLSRGLHQRVGIARVLLHDPSVILLDEPYTGLDARAVEMLNEVLDAAVSNGRNTIILTTHDVEHGLRAATRAVIIDRGKLVFSSAAGDPAVREAFARYLQRGETR